MRKPSHLFLVSRATYCVLPERKFSSIGSFPFPVSRFPFLFPPLSPVIYFSFFSIPVSLLLLFLTIWTECLLSASWKGGKLVDFYRFVSVLSVSCALNSIDPHVLPEYIVGR